MIFKLIKVDPVFIEFEDGKPVRVRRPEHDFLSIYDYLKRKRIEFYYVILDIKKTKILGFYYIVLKIPDYEYHKLPDNWSYDYTINADGEFWSSKKVPQKFIVDDDETDWKVGYHPLLDGYNPFH